MRTILIAHRDAASPSSSPPSCAPAGYHVIDCRAMATRALHPLRQGLLPARRKAADLMIYDPELTAWMTRWPALQPGGSTPPGPTRTCRCCWPGRRVRPARSDTTARDSCRRAPRVTWPPARAAALRQIHDPCSCRASAGGSPMKVLVIDDDPRLRDALEVGIQLQWQDAQVLHRRRRRSRAATASSTKSRTSCCST